MKNLIIMFVLFSSISAFAGGNGGDVTMKQITIPSPTPAYYSADTNNKEACAESEIYFNGNIYDTLDQLNAAARELDDIKMGQIRESGFADPETLNCLKDIYSKLVLITGTLI